MSSLTEAQRNDVIGPLAAANGAFASRYPGETGARQPVHTVYGGAQLYKAGAAQKLGQLALRNLDAYAADSCAFARALGLPGADRLPDRHAEPDPDAFRDTHPDHWLAHSVYNRVRHKLETEAVEDQRIDFEDGYGNRPDDEEDAHAVNAAEALHAGMQNDSLPPFIGIRIKSFTEECRQRAMRTLDLFLVRLAELGGGQLPSNFVVMLPKVTIPEQVAALAQLLKLYEKQCGFGSGNLKLEIMVETTQAIIDCQGSNAIRRLVAAADGRCVAVHFGTYDYTAACNITAAHQRHTHPAADYARHALQVALAGTGIAISDGATTTMPVPRYKASADAPLTADQDRENRRVVHAAWREHFDNVTRSLEHGYYQSWDLNPAQLPARYAAVYAFFLQGLDDASRRLQAFLNKAAQATLVGNTFDDAATGQGLLNYFLRGLACGALTEAEVLATGISLDELRAQSFVKIVAGRTS